MTFSLGFFAFIFVMVILVMFKRTVSKAVSIVDNTLDIADKSVKAYAVETAIERSNELKKNHGDKLGTEEIINIDELFNKLK